MGRLSVTDCSIDISTNLLLFRLNWLYRLRGQAGRTKNRP
jgi:hypothetical protein